MSPRKAVGEGREAHPPLRVRGPVSQRPGRRPSCYCWPRALSRLLLMVSRKSEVFMKCSFSFTLPRENPAHVRGRGRAGAC